MDRPVAPPMLSRRDFLKGLGLTVAGLLAGCVPASPSPAPTAVPSPPPSAPPPTVPPASPTATLAPTDTPTAAPTATPAPTDTPTATPTATPAPTDTPTSAPTATSAPVDTPTAAPTATSAPPPRPYQVAIGTTPTYDYAAVRSQLAAMLDGLGGLGDIVRPGARVAIKVNLTGGMHFSPPPGVTAVESYLTHPTVVRALGELLRDAGAGPLFIVEAVFDAASFSTFGYGEVASYLGATLVDLNSPAPYADFVSVPVAGGLAYGDFVLNPLLVNVDLFVSVAKMKCHYNCGVTLAMKNLIGLVPTAYYRLSEEHWWRSALHGQDEAEAGTRLPRVIVDLNRARPIHLAVIDGVKTAEGGEVPRGGFAPVQPGVLVAGKNAVATDAVATAVMGFDPTGDYPNAPFLRGGNHLNLAAGMGLGSNRLADIAIVGASIESVRYPFAPA